MTDREMIAAISKADDPAGEDKGKNSSNGDS